MDKEQYIEELKKQVAILKQELKDKETVLNGLLNMLDKNLDESEDD